MEITCENFVSTCGASIEDMEIKAHQDIDIFGRLISILLALACVLCASFASGLTVGLACVDKDKLTVLAGVTLDNVTEPDERLRLIEEKYMAKQMLTVVSDKHLLLVTLILLNSVANEALPLFLDHIFSKMVACAVSVFLVIFVSEILPITIFTGPQQIRMASRLVPMVKVLMFVCYPLTRPVAKLLDKINPDTPPARPIESATKEELEHDDDSCKHSIASVRIPAIKITWKTFTRAPKLPAKEMFRGFAGEPLKTSESFLVCDGPRFIGWLSVLDLAAEHARDGDKLVEEFDLKKLIFFSTEEEEPSVFAVLQKMVALNVQFSICGNENYSEGYVSIHHVLQQLCSVAEEDSDMEMEPRRPRLTSPKTLHECFNEDHSRAFERLTLANTLNKKITSRRRMGFEYQHTKEFIESGDAQQFDDQKSPPSSSTPTFRKRRSCA